MAYIGASPPHGRQYGVTWRERRQHGGLAMAAVDVTSVTIGHPGIVAPATGTTTMISSLINQLSLQFQVARQSC